MVNCQLSNDLVISHYIANIPATRPNGLGSAGQRSGQYVWHGGDNYWRHAEHAGQQARAVREQTSEVAQASGRSARRRPKPLPFQAQSQRTAPAARAWSDQVTAFLRPCRLRGSHCLTVACSRKPPNLNVYRYIRIRPPGRHNGQFGAAASPAPPPRRRSCRHSSARPAACLKSDHIGDRSRAAPSPIAHSADYSHANWLILPADRSNCQFGAQADPCGQEGSRQA